MRRRVKKRVVKKRKSTLGFSLVEVVIAVLLISVVVTSVFSVTLTAKTASKKTERRSSALAYTRQVQEMMKSYVREPVAAGMTDPSGGTTWQMPGDSCNTGLGTCATATCYAMEPCTHDLTSLLPATCSNTVGFCSGAPVNGKITYTVTGGGAGGSLKVQFGVTWDE